MGWGDRRPSASQRGAAKVVPRVALTLKAATARIVKAAAEIEIRRTMAGHHKPEVRAPGLLPPSPIEIGLRMMTKPDLSSSATRRSATTFAVTSAARRSAPRGSSWVAEVGRRAEGSRL